MEATAAARTRGLHLPHPPWARVAVAVVVALALVITVPPLRRVLDNALSKLVLLAASPFAPSIGNFNALPGTTKIVAADGSTIATLDGGRTGQPVALDTLPDHVVHAVLAAEDADFYHHSGIDPIAMARAAVADVTGKHIQGGSTITQQLAKLDYTGSHHSVLRKVREALYAVRLEDTYSKRTLLQHYLNEVYFGDGSYGITAAAKDFFGVDPQQLTPAQAATLAGKIRAPQVLDPRTDPHATQVRRDQVLKAMRRHGWLTQAQLDQALQTPMQPAPRPAAGGGKDDPAAHFVEYVKSEAQSLDQLGGSPESRAKQLFTGGYTIDTTLDPKALDAAQAAIKANLGGPGDPHTSIVSVKPGDGAITVLTDGIDPTSQFLVASQGQRQPGSSFKPYVYLAMLDAGLDPRSTVDTTSPMTVAGACRPPYTVKNYEGTGNGPTSIDEGLAQSINVVFAQVIARVGPAAVRQESARAGFDPDELQPVQCPIALGGLRHGVSPLEQAAAFATFAAHGVYAQPYAITRIVDRRGREIYRHEPQTRTAFDAKEVGVLTAALAGVVDHGTGTAAAIGRPLAGKTGTTENSSDAWFIGFVPQLATAVWVGHPVGTLPMTDVHGITVTGGTFPARIFSAYMRAALASVPPMPLSVASPDALALHPLAPPSTQPPTLPSNETTPTITITLPTSIETSTTSTEPTTPTTMTQPTEPPATSPPTEPPTTSPPATSPPSTAPPSTSPP